jgi:hypothetical protein
MTGVRSQIDLFLARQDETGLVTTPAGWNYVDVAQGEAGAWHHGAPPLTDDGICIELNIILVYALMKAAELEQAFGESLLAERCRFEAGRIAERLEARFLSEQGIFAIFGRSGPGTEHALAVALCSGAFGAETKVRMAQALLSRDDIVRTNIYFTHYLFEAYARLGRTDRLIGRMAPWFELRDNGFRTTPETWGRTRSDCHAWGAHPLYHYFATILGIRPAEFGFGSIHVAPCLGPLEYARGILPHPEGDIRAEFRRRAKRLEGVVVLPPGVSGSVKIGDIDRPLGPGQNRVSTSQ